VLSQHLISLSPSLVVSAAVIEFDAEVDFVSVDMVFKGVGVGGVDERINARSPRHGVQSCGRNR
jgi:hypothetical protein